SDVVKAGARLIQQQKGDIHQQRAAEIDKLAVTVWKIADHAVPAAHEAEAIEDLVDAKRSCALGRTDMGKSKEFAGEAISQRAMTGDLKIFTDRKVEHQFRM